MTDLMTVPEAAKLLGVRPVTLYIAIREGRLHSVEILGKKAVSRSEILAYQQRTQSVGPKGGRPRKKAEG